jgi:hypothetical protein
LVGRDAGPAVTFTQQLALARTSGAGTNPTNQATVGVPE